jgi:hypothetical protein
MALMLSIFGLPEYKLPVPKSFRTMLACFSAISFSGASIAWKFFKSDLVIGHVGHQPEQVGRME